MAELNRVEFVCDEPEDGYEDEAQKLSKKSVNQQSQSYMDEVLVKLFSLK